MGIPAPIGIAASGLPDAGDQANAVNAGTFTAVGPSAPFALRGPANLAIWASVITALTTTALSTAATVASATGLAAGNAINSKLVPKGSTIGVLAGTNVTLALPTLTYWATGLNTSSASLTLPPGSNVTALIGATVTVPSNAEGVTFPTGTKIIAVSQADVAPSLNSPGVPGIVQLNNAPTAVPSLNAPQPLAFALAGNAVATSAADAAATFTGSSVVYVGTIELERSFDGGATWIVCNIDGGGTLASFSAGTPVSLTFGEPEKDVLYRLNCTAYTSGTINWRLSQTGGAAESLAIGPLSNG